MTGRISKLHAIEYNCCSRLLVSFKVYNWVLLDICWLRRLFVNLVGWEFGFLIFSKLELKFTSIFLFYYVIFSFCVILLFIYVLIILGFIDLIWLNLHMCWVFFCHFMLSFFLSLYYFSLVFFGYETNKNICLSFVKLVIRFVKL